MADWMEVLLGGLAGIGIGVVLVLLLEWWRWPRA